MPCVKFVGGEGFRADGHICIIRHEETPANEEILKKYLKLQGYDPDDDRYLLWYYEAFSNPRNMAIALVRRVIPWFHDDSWEIIGNSEVPSLPPDHEREGFAVWYFKKPKKER